MLAKLPADRQIVSCCYSGQTASRPPLRLLGYDAYNMQFGMPQAIVEGVSTGVWDDSKAATTRSKAQLGGTR